MIGQSLRMEIAEGTAVGAIRREASRLAERLGFDEEDVARVAIVASEAASNVWKHAAGGEALIGVYRAEMVEIVVLDRGPGIRDLASSFRDGTSTGGTAGCGLGAISRQATSMDVYSHPNEGTVLVARIGRRADAAAFRAERPSFGAICVPVAHETVCGDAWACLPAESGRWRLLVADGLGHGPSAAEASGAAVSSFAKRALPPAEALQAIHGALRPTRGAAVAVVEVDPGRELLRFAGIGNVSGVIVGDAGRRSLVSHHGTAGHDARRIQEFEYPFEHASLLLVHSDGLATHWSLERYPGLRIRHPATVAGVLYRDFRRARDDVTVVAFRAPR